MSAAIKLEETPVILESKPAAPEEVTEEAAELVAPVLVFALETAQEAREEAAEDPAKPIAPVLAAALEAPPGGAEEAAAEAKPVIPVLAAATETHETVAEKPAEEEVVIQMAAEVERQGTELGNIVPMKMASEDAEKGGKLTVSFFHCHSLYFPATLNPCNRCFAPGKQQPSSAIPSLPSAQTTDT